MRVVCAQVIDEMSTDQTPEHLQKAGVKVMMTPGIQGVTANWNIVRPIPRHLMKSKLRKCRNTGCLC